MKNKREILIEQCKIIDAIAQEIKLNAEGISLVKNSISVEYLHKVAQKIEIATAKIKIALL